MVFILIFFSVSFLFFSSSPASAGDEIVIGGSIPLSGGAAETGRNVYNGYQAAVKMINEKQGGVKVGDKLYKLKLTMFDDASDPSRATTLIQRQIDEGVDFFLGSFSSKMVLPTCSITDRAKKPIAHLSLQVATRAYVIEKGEVTLSGSGQELLNSEFVKKAFLGM